MLFEQRILCKTDRIIRELWRLRQCTISIGMDDDTKDTKTREQAASLSTRKVRELLGPLSAEQLRRAVAAGLLKTRGRDHYDTASVLDAHANLEAWRERLAGEELLNATEAARRLGVTTERFRRAVTANDIKPVERTYWRYGRYISYYRARDVDSLASWLVADAAERHVEAVAKRPEAARKAAETRRRNLEAKKAARDRLVPLIPGLGASDADIICFAVALLLAADKGCSKLQRFTRDKKVHELADLIATARLSKEEHQELLSRYHAQALKAARRFERVRDLENAHGLHPGSLYARLDCVAGTVSRLQFDRLLREDPAFIEDSRRKNQERLLLEEAHRVAALEAERVERERRAMVAKAEILAHAPGEDAHPADVMRWALPAILAFSGGAIPAVQHMASSVGEDYMVDIRRVQDKIGSHRLDDKEFLDYLLQQVKHARDRMDSLHRVLHNRFPQRLNELRQRGLKTAGELAVLEEAEALIRSDPQLAARWEREDEKDAERQARKRERRRRKRAKKAGQMQLWREQWAAALGIPVEKVPARMSRPTLKGIQQMLAHRPGWAKVE